MDEYTVSATPRIVGTHALIHFDVLERLCEIGAKALADELEILHEAMDRDYEGFDSEYDEGDYLAHINDEYIEVSDVLPYLHWYSQLLISYSFFERAMDALCCSFQRQNKHKVSFKDIRGQGIQRSKNYLEKICGISDAFKAKEWHSAIFYADVRNAIAHKSGYVAFTPDDKKSPYRRMRDRGIELRQEQANQEDAQIILSQTNVIASIQAYRVVIQHVTGLGSHFITPKHGLPSEPYGT